MVTSDDRSEPCLSLVANRASPYISIMETSVEKLVAINFLVFGLSHLLQPRVWVQFFIMLREKGEVGSFLNGFVHFPLGAFIVAFHNVWHGIPMIVTIIGWGLVIKSTLYFMLSAARSENARDGQDGKIVAFRGGRRVQHRARRFDSVSAL